MASETETVERNALQKRKTVVGTVTSDKMQKTIVVRVDRMVRHPLYKKIRDKVRSMQIVVS